MSALGTRLATTLGTRLGTSIGVDGDPVEKAILDRLATIPGSVWFDPAWDDGVVTADDSGTLRYALILSRPIHTQYDVASVSTPQGPAVVKSPNGKNIMSFGGSHWLGGAGSSGLATQLQGSASYSEIQLASRTDGGNLMGRWTASLNAAAPDHRIHHDVNGSNLTLLQRTASGFLTQNIGDFVSENDMHVWTNTYNGSDYDGWLDGVAETLTNGGSNTRVPAALDDIIIGARRSGGNPGAFWVGLQCCLVLCPGTVLSTVDRQGLEADLAAYYGY